MADSSDRTKLIEINILLKKSLAIVNCTRLSDYYTYLKPKQVQCIRQCVEHHSDLLAVLSTGSGKSLVFIVIPVYELLFSQYKNRSQSASEKSITIVVSPLNAIISQQYEVLGEESAIIINRGEYLLKFCINVLILLNVYLIFEHKLTAAHIVYSSSAEKNMQ